MLNPLSELLEHVDNGYKLFSEKLIPDTILPILGVRVPTIKELAKSIVKNYSYIEILDFLKQKHHYYEEWFLHGTLLGELKVDFNHLICLIDNFIPYIDNWAICDSTVSHLKIFNKYPNEVLVKTNEWLCASNPYIVRFAIVTLLNYFLDKNFDNKILDIVAKIKSTNYYVNMAIAWFFSVAIIKQYEQTIPYIENKEFCTFIQNKTIQKALDSFRLSMDKKDYLKTLRIKKGERNGQQKCGN